MIIAFNEFNNCNAWYRTTKEGLVTHLSSLRAPLTLPKSEPLSSPKFEVMCCIISSQNITLAVFSSSNYSACLSREV